MYYENYYICTFDNNLPCIAEKEVVAVDSICDELMKYMVEEQGCYLANQEIQQKLIKTVFDEKGNLTNAGALLADESPVRHSRLFCTRWN